MLFTNHIEKMEALLINGRVRGMSRSMVSLNAAQQILKDMHDDLPEQIKQAEAILRQKDGVVKQGEIEARRIRAYADEEANTIRRMAEDQSNEMIDKTRQEVADLIKNDTLVKESRRKAETIEKEAKTRAENLIRQADIKANKVLNEATNEIETRRKGADEYAREVLFGLEERTLTILGQVRSGLDLLDQAHGAGVASLR